jgi:hypothetical protein
VGSEETWVKEIRNGAKQQLRWHHTHNSFTYKTVPSVQPQESFAIEASDAQGGNRGAEPDHGCDCHLSGRSRHCRTFAQSHPEVPEYSVHDIARIGLSKKKLEELVTRKLYTLDAVPDDFAFGEAQTL